MVRPLILLIGVLIGSTQTCWGDVIKPALTEITVDKSGAVEIQMRVSIEALLTGINAEFENTQASPNGAIYDELRTLSPAELADRFADFEKTFIESVSIDFDGLRSKLSLDSVSIPEPGYIGVPRISELTLSTRAPESAEALTWQYPEAFGDNAVRVRQVDQAQAQWHWSEWQWLKQGRASEPFSLSEVYARRTQWQSILDYMVIGFEHIVPLGLDHILFVVGLFLFSLKLRPLLLQVTMFTIAHSLTLALASLDLIALPARWVEPVIALSIAYIGIENIFFRHLGTHRLVLVFIFGLVHGLGFAEALADFGMQSGEFFTALLGFNLGVELGQVAIILTLYALFGAWGRNNPLKYRRFIVIPVSCVITLMASVWTVQRILV